MTESAMIWVGRAVSGLVVLFLLGASVAPKLLGMKIAGETLTKLGWIRAIFRRSASSN